MKNATKYLLCEHTLNKGVSLQSIVEKIEQAVALLGPDELEITAVVYTTEETPYIDALILSEFIHKALVRTKHPAAARCRIGVDLDNTTGKTAIEIYRGEKDEQKEP